MSLLNLPTNSERAFIPSRDRRREDSRLAAATIRYWPFNHKQALYDRSHYRELEVSLHHTRREFLKEILYKNIAIIAVQHSKIYLVDTFGDFSHIVERNSLKSIWQIFLYILA